MVKGVSTDLDGNFSIKPIKEGRYNVQFKYLGYKTFVMKDIYIRKNQTTNIVGNLRTDPSEHEVVEFKVYKKPLINKNYRAVSKTREETSNVNSVVSLSAGMTSGDDLSARGGRTDANTYYIDGIKVDGYHTYKK